MKTRYQIILPAVLAFTACLEVPLDLPAAGPADSGTIAEVDGGETNGPRDASAGVPVDVGDDLEFGGRDAAPAFDADTGCQDECQLGEGRCVPQEMAPDVYQTCRLGADGCNEFRDSLQCQQGQRCREESGCYCLGVICSDGEYSCRDNVIVQCSRATTVCGVKEDVRNCPTFQGLACEEPNDGECTQCECIPGHEQCVGNIKQNCVDSGPGCPRWYDFAPHATAEQCAERTLHCGEPTDCLPCGDGFFCPN